MFFILDLILYDSDLYGIFVILSYHSSPWRFYLSLAKIFLFAGHILDDNHHWQ